MKRTLFIILALSFSSCVRKSNSPEGALKDYIDYRFSDGQRKSKLLEKTTGHLHQIIDSHSEQQLNNIVNPNEYKKRKIKINLKKCTGNECHITYTLRLSKVKSKKKTYDIEVKKIATIQMSDGSWKISNISDIKTYVKAHKDLKVSAE